MSEPNAQAAVARSLTARTGLDWDPADVAMTNGGFAALAVTLRAIVEPGDEVVFLSPPWFFYELLIVAADGVPGPGPARPAGVRSRRRPRSRPRSRRGPGRSSSTRPHNPTGRIYPLEALRALGDMLARRSAGRDRPILLISDEPYNRIVFDGGDVPQPGRGLPEHDHHLLVRQDPARARDADRLRDDPADDARPRVAPPGGLRRPDRDRLRVPERPAPARDRGPRAAVDRHRRPRAPARPAGPGAPGDWATRRRCRRARSTSWPARRSPTTSPSPTCLAEHGALVLPGTVVEVPGWFRISLTASEEMVERGLRSFARGDRGRRAGSQSAVGRVRAGPAARLSHQPRQRAHEREASPYRWRRGRTRAGRSGSAGRRDEPSREAA